MKGALHICFAKTETLLTLCNTWGSLPQRSEISDTSQPPNTSSFERADKSSRSSKSDDESSSASDSDISVVLPRWPSNVFNNDLVEQNTLTLDEDENTTKVINNAKNFTFASVDIVIRHDTEFTKSERRFICEKLQMKMKDHPGWCEWVTARAWHEAGLPGNYPVSQVSDYDLDRSPSPPTLLCVVRKPDLPRRPLSSNIHEPVKPYIGTTNKREFLLEVTEMTVLELRTLLRRMGARVGNDKGAKQQLKLYGVEKVSSRLFSRQELAMPI